MKGRCSVDVVIVAHNRWDLTESCLRHLRDQTVAHRAIVVDNGSDDGTAERLAADWPEVRVVALPTNHGFAAASNRGAREGDGDVVVLLNNDVDCRPDLLQRLCAPLEDDARVGSVAALMLRPGEEAIDSVGLVADPTLASFPRHQGAPPQLAGAPAPLLTGPSATAAAYRRSAWEQVGGLDEAIRGYYEDFDLALRLRAAGWRTAVAVDAVGVHLGSATYGHRSALQRLHGGFGRGYLLRRYGVLRRRGAARALLTELIVICGDLVLSRDLAALRGRLAGWRAARGRGRLAMPPPDAVDWSIDLRESLALRRGVYERRG